MVDLKKEIKLSDLVPRRKPKAGGSEAQEPALTHAPPAKRELVGLKIGASQLAAARVMNNGSANLVQLARGPLDRGVVVEARCGTYPP